FILAQPYPSWGPSGTLPLRSRRRLHVRGNADEVAVEGDRAVHVGCLVTSGERACVLAGSREPVETPHPRLAPLQEISRPQRSGRKQGDDEGLHGIDVLG